VSLKNSETKVIRGLLATNWAIYDNDLKPLSVVEETTQALNDHLSSVAKSKDGGYYVVGCGLEKGVAIAYLNSSGHLVDVKGVNPNKGALWCSAPGMALDADGDSVVFLVGLIGEGAKKSYWLYRATVRH
jgi:hypothetical protein